MIRETVAPGFTLYEDDDEDMPKWTVTGVLPSEGVWGDISHYDLEDSLVEQGILRRNQCDSESGQFFVYPVSEEEGRRVGAWLKERLERDVLKGLLA